MPVWMTVEEAMKLTGLSPLRIMDLVKSLQVGFTRNGDGILLVDAEALETHVPAQGAHSPALAPTRDLGAKLTTNAVCKLRREVSVFLDNHPDTSMRGLSVASGLGKGVVGEIMSKKRQQTCHSWTAAAIRKAMREWPEEENTTEPKVDIATIRQHWDELPAELKRMGRTAGGVFVREAQPEALDGDVLTLVFAPPFTFHYYQVTGPYKALVEQALERLYGRPLTVRTRFAEPAQDDVDPFAEPAQDVAVEQPEPIKRTLWQRLFGGR